MNFASTVKSIQVEDAFALTDMRRIDVLGPTTRLRIARTGEEIGTFSINEQASEQRRMTKSTVLASGLCVHDPFKSFTLEGVNDEMQQFRSDALTYAAQPLPRTRPAFVLPHRTSPCSPHALRIA